MARRYLDRHDEVKLEAALRKQEQTDKTIPQAQQRTMATWNGLVEQRILDGIARGMFDNLQGEGKPLNLDDDALVPVEMKMAFRMLRSTGLAPLWVELNKEIRDDIARMALFRLHAHSRWHRASQIEHDHLRQQYTERINETNLKIRDYNILAPSSQVHLPLLVLNDELAKFDQAVASNP